MWEETRVALFPQATDDRGDSLAQRLLPERVSFGHGWVRQGAHELFAESVALHAPLLPLCTLEDARAQVRAGAVPQLSQLRLHQGTVWTWNRAIYDPSAGGHLRIEMRALPAGPTPTDMLANGAFLLGLTLGLAAEVDRLLPAARFGDESFFVQCIHRCEVKALPYPSVLELEDAQQRKNCLFDLDHVVFHGIPLNVQHPWPTGCTAAAGPDGGIFVIP